LCRPVSSPPCLVVCTGLASPWFIGGRLASPCLACSPLLGHFIHSRHYLLSLQPLSRHAR
jgi:hypothetical protein